MRILIIDGQPDEASFGAALARSYAAGATEGAHEVRLLSLRTLDFDPILHGGFTSPQPLEPAPGFAVEHIEGFPYVRKLLGGRSARVIYTQNSPQWLAVLAREDLFWRVMRRAILDTAGSPRSAARCSHR